MGGIPAPDLVEVALVCADLGRFGVSDEIFPTLIDLPNNPNDADRYLGRFAFNLAGAVAEPPPGLRQRTSLNLDPSHFPGLY